MLILLLNAGSSSLKGSLVDSSDGRTVAAALADWAGETTQYHFTGADGCKISEEVPWHGHRAAVQRFLHDLTHVRPAALSDHSGIAAVGHRVVHGGDFTSSVLVTSAVRERIAALVDLAPLHNPPSLETLLAAEEALPGTPHIAVFDTAFHTTLPPEARHYAIPDQWTREWGIHRFGFHGLSHAYCAGRAAEFLGRPGDSLRIIICHLGHGCSASAVENGRCIDTTMGFTPLEGLMMATRSGSLDPGAILHVQQRHGLTAAEVERTLNRESGLLGVSGVSADMRQVLAAAHDGHERSRLALAIYTHRVRQTIGAFTATLGGVDALVFTAGVGEHAAEVRAMICRGLDGLGLCLDPAANATCSPDADVAASDSTGRILVIATREDVTMLREVLQTLAMPPSDGPDCS